MIGAAVALIIATMFLATRSGENERPDRRVSLTPPPEGSVSSPFGREPGAPPASAPEPLKIAVGAIVSPAKSLVFYEEIFDYIGEKLHREVEMVQRKTYAEVNFLIKERLIDAAFVCSRPYVEGHREFGMELLCVPVCFGKTEYYSYLIVHKDSPIRKLEDLRGKVFAFSDPLSNSGMLVPTYILARMGETPEAFFKDYIFTYSHDNSIRSVAERFVDGAAVDSLIWDYENSKEPKWTVQTRIIYRSASYAIPPVVVSANIDRELKEKLRSAFLTMHEDPEGIKILKKVLIDRFTIIEDSAYDSIRETQAFVKDFRSRVLLEELAAQADFCSAHIASSSKIISPFPPPHLAQAWENVNTKVELGLQPRGVATSVARLSLMRI